ncbi:Uncharacterised protein [Mycobacteroides abscessus]|nr:Uncharacterised protein [Mycobacteroides abscessus]
MHDAVEAVRVLAHRVREAGEVVVVRDVELHDGRLDRQALREGLRELHLAAERGEHDLGTLLLREPRRVERDRGVGEHSRDEELLAVEQTHRFPSVVRPLWAR